MKPNFGTKFMRIIQYKFFDSWIFWVVTFFTFAVGRIINSADRLPPDPSYGFFEESYAFNFWVIFRTEGGYLDIPRRLLSELIVLFPMRYTALLGTAIWVVICVSSALIVSLIVFKSLGNSLVAFLCGLTVVLVPSASESQVGNQSVIKWPLILVLIFVLSASKNLEIYMKSAVLAAVVTGVSNPVTFLAFGAFMTLLFVRRERVLQPKYLWVVGAFIFGFLVEFFAWKSTGVGVHKYQDRVYFLWSGAGAFWIYNFFAPPCTLIALGMARLPVLRVPHPSVFVQNLSFYGIVLWAGTFYLGGIADRYFVVPQILAFSAFIIYCSENLKSLNRPLQIACVVFAAIGIFAMAYWYQASWFLSSGPQWSFEIDKKVNECLNSPINSITIRQFMGDFNLDCHSLLNRS